MSAQSAHKEGDKFQEQVLVIKRVSKKTSGGNYATFSALVAIGDGQGNVGVGMGRAKEVPPAIQKAIVQAKKNVISFSRHKTTIPHQVVVKYKSARILIKPAPEGTGLKVGSVARTILNLGGVENASGKIMGTRNHVTNTHAVMKALQQLHTK